MKIKIYFHNQQQIILLFYSVQFYEIEIKLYTKGQKMGSKLRQQILNKIFEKMIMLNKIQITSLGFVYLTVLLKSILGTVLVMIVFFSDEDAMRNFCCLVRSYLTLKDNDQNTTKIITAVVFTVLNLFILSSFCIQYRKKSQQIIDKILLFLLILLQSFKYISIIIICSQLRYFINNNDIIFSVINCINLFGILYWTLLFDNFYFTIKYGMRNLLAKFYSSYHIAIQMVLAVITIVYTMLGPYELTFIQRIIMNVLIIALKGLAVYISLLKRYYTHKSVQTVYSFLTITELVFLLCNLIIQLTKQKLIRSNFVLVVFTTSTLCFYAWKYYSDSNQEDTCFINAKDIKTQVRVNMFFKALYEISVQSNSINQNSLILSSIRKRHELQCLRSDCYCKDTSENNNFVKEYTLEQLEIIRLNFKNHPRILIQQLNFRFNLYKVYPQVLTRLNYIKNTLASTHTDTFLILNLRKQLIGWIDQVNHLNHLINAETPLRAQQINRQLEKLIKKDIQKKTKKWKYLSKGLCRIQELENDTNTEIQYIKSISNIHDQWLSKFMRSSLFNFLLLFHYKKVSFLNSKTEEIQKNLRQNLKKIKEEELSTVKQFAKCIFHKRSCLIESLIDVQNMGIVTRTSKNIHQLFGYSQNKIIGMNLNKLMPTFMAEQHDVILKDWIKTGTWRTVGKLKQIFCIHKEEYCFNALLYLKIIANEKGLFFITVIFKKNQTDYLILNPKHQIEGMGRKFFHIMGKNCKKIPIKLLVTDFPSIQSIKNQEYKTYTCKFRSLVGNQNLVEEYLQSKNHRILSEQEERQFINQYSSKLEASQDLDRWQIKFDIKIYRMRGVHFYVILLNYAKYLQQQSRRSMTHIDNIRSEMIIGHGKINEQQEQNLSNSDDASVQSLDQRHTQFFEDKNSSMASITQRQSFTLNRLLSIFYQFMMKPKQIKDRRINIFNISTLLETIILTAIISCSFFIYISSLQQIKTYISANSQINQNTQLAIIMYNKVISISEYSDEQQTIKHFLQMATKDLHEFYTNIENNLDNYNLKKSQLHNRRIYDYLRQPATWVYKNGQYMHVQVLQFFQYYYYMVSYIFVNFINDPTQDILVTDQYYYDRVKQNFPQLKTLSREVCSIFFQLTKQTKQHLNMVSWMVVSSFFVITFMFFIYRYMYHNFRHQQKYECFEIYQFIPQNLIDKVKGYYSEFFVELATSQNKHSSGIENHLMVLNEKQLQIDENISSMSHNNIKFLGKQRYLGWIVPLVIFLIVNSINSLITYEVVNFVSQLGEFMYDVNSIMDSQNKLLESYMDLKGAYLLSHDHQINISTIDTILTYMQQNQVTFNKMVTFQSQTLTKYDPDFYADFYQILVQNVCQQTKDILDTQQYKDCLQLTKRGVNQNGVITFMTNFQRKLRVALQDLKVNSTLRFATQQKTYFKNRGFKQIDITLSYNIKLFGKLIQRILKGYNMGIQYISSMNIVVVVILIAPQLFALLMWVHLVRQEKYKLSLLYGSILMIPPNVFKQVKNLPRMAQKVLEFIQN